MPNEDLLGSVVYYYYYYINNNKNKKNKENIVSVEFLQNEKFCFHLLVLPTFPHCGFSKLVKQSSIEFKNISSAGNDRRSHFNFYLHRTLRLS